MPLANKERRRRVERAEEEAEITAALAIGRFQDDGLVTLGRGSEIYTIDEDEIVQIPRRGSG
jgi:hypothetical protein